MTTVGIGLGTAVDFGNGEVLESDAQTPSSVSTLVTQGNVARYLAKSALIAT